MLFYFIVFRVTCRGAINNILNTFLTSNSSSGNEISLSYYKERAKDSTFRYRCRKRSLLVSKFMPNKVDSWLDIGCADGLMFDLIKQPIRNRIGLELDLSLIRVAKKNANCSVIRADAHAIPLRDQSVDFISCTSVLEHLFCPKKVVNDIYRVLSENGKAVIITPNPFAEKVAIFLGHSADVEGHFHHFSLSALIELFKSRNFLIERWGRYLFPPVKSPFSNILEKIFGSLFGVINYVVVRKQSRPKVIRSEVK